MLDPTPLARGLVRKKVEVVNYPDGRFAVQFEGTTFGFTLFDKIQTVQPGAIVDNKRLSAVLAQVKAQQAAYPARQQRGHSARQRPPKGAASRAALRAPAKPAAALDPVALTQAFGSDAVWRLPCPPPSGVSCLLCALGVISILRRQKPLGLPDSVVVEQ